MVTLLPITTCLHLKLHQNLRGLGLIDKHFLAREFRRNEGRIIHRIIHVTTLGALCTATSEIFTTMVC